MNNDKIIITGADGFVGSHIAKLYLEKGFEVLAIDIAESPNRLPSHPNLIYKKIDLFNDLELLRKELNDFKGQSVIYMAWAGSAGPQRADYSLQLRNAETAVKCLEIAKETDCTKFVGAGSIMEYEVEAAVHANGNKPGLGYIYGMGKHIAHCLCKSVAANIGIDLLWPMITNAYGVGELSPRFINTTLRKIIHNQPLEFTAATQNYDFVYVTDVARAFYLVERKGLPFYEYMIGSGNAAPLKSFINEMVSACNSKNKPIFGNVPFTGINLPLSVFSIENLKNDCGFTPEVSFEQGIKLTFDWLKAIENDN